MEKIEKIITETKIIYKAINEKEFDSKEECQKYEYFLKHKENILSKIIYFKEKNGIFTQIPFADLGWFDYCYVTEDTYVQYHKYLAEEKKYSDFFDLKSIGIYHRDYSNAYNGSCGWNGWNYIGTLEQIKKWENLRKLLTNN